MLGISQVGNSLASSRLGTSIQRGGELPTVCGSQGVVVAEDFKDVDHGLPGAFFALALAGDHSKETVKRRLEFGVCGERFGEVHLRFIVIGQLGSKSFEFGDVIAGGLAKTGRRLQPLDVCIRDEFSEADEGFLDVTPVDQQCRKACSCLLVICLLIENLAQHVFSSGRVSRDECGPRLINHLVEFCGKDSLDERLDGLFG